MDIKEKISEVVERVTSDKALMAKFKTNPIGAVEDILGIDLPDDIMEKIVEGVKGKITLDKAKDALEGLKKLF